MKRSVAMAVVLAAIGTVGWAGPAAQFDAAFRDVYASYRAALFPTNSGDSAKSEAAIGSLEAGWSAIEAEYGDAPPPQFAEDPEWGSTLIAVGDDVVKAKAEVASGDLPAAHATLEAVREKIGALHDRNGVETFSDRMNAYHAAMEHALEAGEEQGAGPTEMVERAAVLSWLAADVLQAPPPEAAGSAEWEPLAKAFAASVDDFQVAARSGDMEAARAALGGLKVPYSKLFLKFG